MDNEFFDSTGPSEIEVRRRRVPWLNVVLFLITCLTTTMVGANLMWSFRSLVASTPQPDIIQVLTELRFLAAGLPFSLAVMGILLSHEMGHYLACRYYGIDATLPYFIPFIPLPPGVGTMGAFIRIRSPIHNRGALLDIGVAGPIAGFVVAVPIMFVAMLHSEFVAKTPELTGIQLGDPLVVQFFSYVMGKVPPPGFELYLHPIGVAAWFGFLATALNLLPAGQLDGGHIAYALFGRFHRLISLALIACLVPLGYYYWQGWLVWAVILLLVGFRHPYTMDDARPLERRHIWLGWAALLMFVLSFTPVPIQIDF